MYEEQIYQAACSLENCNRESNAIWAVPTSCSRRRVSTFSCKAHGPTFHLNSVFGRMHSCHFVGTVGAGLRRKFPRYRTTMASNTQPLTPEQPSLDSTCGSPNVGGDYKARSVPDTGYNNGASGHSFIVPAEASLSFCQISLPLFPASRAAPIYGIQL